MIVGARMGEQQFWKLKGLIKKQFKQFGTAQGELLIFDKHKLPLPNPKAAFSYGAGNWY